MTALYIIPREALEVIKKKYEAGAKEYSEYYLDNTKIASRYWYENGQAEFEIFYRDGLCHGPQRRWHVNGQLMWESFYENGEEHGTAKQWNEEGRLLGTYIMNHGTGIDHWWDDEGWLAEEHYWKDGKPHGSERWWSKKEQLSSERYWKEGELHGIWRDWNYSGKLSRGYPQYYINGERVTKKKYLKATEIDPTLVKYNDKDSLSFR
jgi:antitoxin component YwqK of YwqJK toxin-antitoxin module